MSIDDIIKPYSMVMKLLGSKVTLGRARAVEWISKQNGEFTSPELVKGLGIKRTEGYDILSDLEDLGLLRVKNMPSLPDDFMDWSIGRRQKYKKRIDYPRGKIYIVDPTRATGLLEKRKEEIDETIRWIEKFVRG